MDTSAGPSVDDALDPPVHIFDRLRQIAGYTWDETRRPLHTSYDNCHVSSPSPIGRLASSRTSPADGSLFSPTATELSSDHTASASPAPSPAAMLTVNEDLIEEAVVARISYHVLREERSFHIVKNMNQSVDPEGEHIAKPVDLLRMVPHPSDRGPLLVAIYQSPGRSEMSKYIDLGPAFYFARRVGENWEAYIKPEINLGPPISLELFLEFAIGATQCLEMIHHSQNIVHGEIRGDAFHFNADTLKVKLVSFGSGLRSFEHGLMSTGWATLSKELGAKNKLLYISPEQTGRMPAEPDSRTDIYSLGVLFWTLLTQQPVFEGDLPLDIVQGVLGRRILNVSTVRLDVPDAIGRIVQKCTAKNVNDRYHSASGLRHDLVEVRSYLANGDLAALKDWQVASRDVSSFFMLPTDMIGRDEPREQLLNVIERVAKSHAINHKGSGSRFSDGSSFSADFQDTADASSEGGGSSLEGTNARSGSFTHTIASDPKIIRNSFHPSFQSADSFTFSADTMSSNHSNPPLVRLPQRSWERHQSVSFEAKSPLDSILAEREGSSRHTGNSLAAETATSLSRQLGSAKFRRRGHCEIVTVEGAGGLGKSCLVQSVLNEARRRGYCATAKFDKASKTAFGPLLGLLSSLFRQVWGERNTDTPFHQSLKQYVLPSWPMLHQLLGLPEFLFNTPDGNQQSSRQPVSPHASTASFHGKHPRAADLRRRGSSPGSSVSSNFSPMKNGSAPGSIRSSNSASQDFLRAGASTKSIRLMNTVLELLRMFTGHKFICFSIDDLHFADDESLELISQIISARLRMVIIFTYRPEEISLERVMTILNPPDSEDYKKKGGPTITRIQLRPLNEEEIIRYVSITLSRPEAEVNALAVVLQAKTAGNPFFMREMLSACYRKKCIKYDYRDSVWRYDLNRVFEQFQGDSDYDLLNTDFITSRLMELPPASRAILGWAALIGSSFSFGLICHLLSGEFNFFDETCPKPLNQHSHAAFSQGDAVIGLQAAVQACILVSSETDDGFRFAHDRYVVASSDLAVCSIRKMHYVIARTLMEYYSDDLRMRDIAASHICDSIDVIKKRVHRRYAYRKLLFECARIATENGARPTAAKYYSNAIGLLQPEPWEDDDDDVSYEETLQLYVRAAECYLYDGHQSLANGILATIYKCAKLAIDKAPAWIIQSRIYAQNGKASLALSCLKESLKDLGVSVIDNPTFEQCDRDYDKLVARIKDMDRSDLQSRATSEDPNMASIGAVLAEAASISWWSDGIYFYHLSIVMVNMHLESGAFPQSGMGFLHMAMVSIARFNRIQFGADMGITALELLDRFREPFTMARGYMIFANFVGHIQYPLAMAVTQLEVAIEYGTSAGDRVTAILGYGLSAMMRFFSSEACTDLEAFCHYCCEEIPNWQDDPHGGTLLTAIHQVSRALQGKTTTSSALEIMDDELHSSAEYKEWLQSSTTNSERSLLIYETMEAVPLYLYGHYDRVIELGERCMERGYLILSSRNTRLVMLFLGLALAGLELRQQDLPQMDDAESRAERANRLETTIARIKELSHRIRDWAEVSDINYFSWYTLLDAQVSELTRDCGQAIRQYEEALDHASEHDFLFEEALGNYLMAGTFIRKRARRSARSALRDAVGLYRQLAAVGVADRIEEEHSLLLRGPTRNLRTLDAAVQTDFAADTSPVQFRAIENEEERPTGDAMTGGGETSMAELKGERIGAWRGKMQAETESGAAGLPALDMIDLHAILQSSQVISSELRVDELLKTMCDVILQTCGGSATQAAIVVQDEGGSEWCVAASGEPEKGAVSHRPGVPLKGTCMVAENVVLYSMRFREPVFVPDLISDERFGNVPDCWIQKNPRSKSVISIPICHASNPLLGVLYLEGLPGAFTDRNVTVLQLLVNQIGISYSNALSIKAIEKVSAENRSMVTMQKTALRKAIEAENKAKAAEQEAKINLNEARIAREEALHNVKVAEEATKAKSIFLANVSHELRTPLNGVIGNSELLRDSNLTPEQQEMSEAIRLSADLLLIVINDILDFSRMEADKMKLYITAFNPKELMPEVVRAASYRNQDKTKAGVVEIIKQINLPPNLFVFGDPVRLHQVIGNLIGNSIKFTERGTITVGARVDSETEGTVTLTFWVEDTGIGIPPEQLAKLFQPFSQADTSTARKYGGSGLGLSICKSLIKIMEGKIYLESTENVGTRAWFTVTFDKAEENANASDAPATVAASSPLGDENSSSPITSSFNLESALRTTQKPHGLAMRPAVSSVPAPAVEAESTNPYMDLSHIDHDDLRVCIAEDNPINRKIAIQYVQRLGYKIADAYDNGQKAVEALRAKAKEGMPYHIVLMDVQMPVLDGYEATKLLRRDPIKEVREVLVIAMTASAIQGDREKCIAAGMNDYLAKPVKSDVLKSKLDAYIGTPPGSAQNSTTGDAATAHENHHDHLRSNSQTHNSHSAAQNQTVQYPSVRPEPEPTSSFLSNVPPDAPTAKRQPKKLTKARTGSDANATVPQVSTTSTPSPPSLAAAPPSTNQEKPKSTPSVLQKKNPAKRLGGSHSPVPDGTDNVGSSAVAPGVYDDGHNGRHNGSFDGGPPASDASNGTTAVGPSGAQRPSDGRNRSLSIPSIIGTPKNKEQ
ncbi:Chk1 protein kinase [Sporothrix eucalyptigena]